MQTNDLPFYPVEGNVLVRLLDDFGSIVTTEKKFDSKTKGVIVKVTDANADWFERIGKTAYWEEYKDNVRFKHDDEEYAFIAVEDIRGYSDVTN